MIEYTTPTLAIEIDGMDLTGCDVHVTFKSASKDITIENPALAQVDETHWIASVPLTQLQTAGMVGHVAVQANVLDLGGWRGATNKRAINVSANLLRKELPDG